MFTNTDHGVQTFASSHSVEETLNRVETLARQRGMSVFARIDFSKDAAAAGLVLRPTQLLIVGNPKGGTPLMAASPSAALDLPLKVLAWQDDAQQCRIAINAPTYLQQRHGFPAELLDNISGLQKLLESAIQ